MLSAGLSVMVRRVLAVSAAVVIVAIATPAWAGPVTLTVSGIPDRIFYNTPFTITINYANNSGATVVNPHPYVFLSPTPNLPGGLCNPGFKASMAELTQPSAAIDEHEMQGGASNCQVRWIFSKDAHWNLPNGFNSNWTQVKITARPPNGITTLNLKVLITDPDHPDAAYAQATYAIPVATLPPPPSPITPTTHAPTPAASPTAAPSPSDSPTPSAEASGEPSMSPPSPSVKPASGAAGGSLWIVVGIVLVVIGAAALALVLRWRNRPEADDEIFV